jgi:YbbR domain-containing protein
MFSQNLNKFFRTAVENWVPKVLSVALALVIFIIYRMSTLETRFFSSPLVLELPSHLCPSSPYARMIRITLRGDANHIQPIQDDDIEAYIDLNSYESPGSYQVPIRIRKKGTALGVEPLEISVDPVAMNIELDYKQNKYVPLMANIDGSPEPGFDLVSHSLSPTQVVLEGPSGLLDNVQELYTDVIDLNGRNADFSVAVAILNRDPLLTIRGNGMTEFKGFIHSRIDVRNFGNISIALTNLSSEFRADPDFRTGTVRLEGNRGNLDAFSPPPSFLMVDCSAITEPGRYTLPVKVSLPPSLRLVRADPENLGITVELIEIEEEEQ